MSVSDEITKKIFDKAPDAVSKAYQGTKQVGHDVLHVGGKVLENSIKGICLILEKGTEFTTQNVMEAVRKVAFNKTGAIEYSKQNIVMEELKKSGSVTKIEERITADVMQYFDKNCKRFGVKYNAVRDERDPDNPKYIVFFNGKDDKTILEALKESYIDYAEAQKNPEQQREQKERGKESKQNGKHREKESVRAKLAFFRNRVADRDKEQGDVEKHHNRSERQR